MNILNSYANKEQVEEFVKNYTTKENKSHLAINDPLKNSDEKKFKILAIASKRILSSLRVSVNNEDYVISCFMIEKDCGKKEVMGLILTYLKKRVKRNIHITISVEEIGIINVLLEQGFKIKSYNDKKYLLAWTKAQPKGNAKQPANKKPNKPKPQAKKK